MESKMVDSAALFLIFLLGCTFLITACGSGSSTSSSGCTIEVEISPNTASVIPSNTQSFSGTETKTCGTSIEVDGNHTAFGWAIEEGSAGGTLQVNPLSSVLYTYTAPSTEGTYHVVITSKEDSSVSATATVNVETLLLE